MSQGKRSKGYAKVLRMLPDPSSQLLESVGFVRMQADDRMQIAVVEGFDPVLWYVHARGRQLGARAQRRSSRERLRPQREASQHVSGYADSLEPSTAEPEADLNRRLVCIVAGRQPALVLGVFAQQAQPFRR